MTWNCTNNKIIIEILVISVFSIVLEVLSIVINSFSLYLLICLHRTGRGNVQYIYLINLSGTNIFASAGFMITNALDICQYYKDADCHCYISNYTNLVLLTVISFVLYMTMTYVIVDELMQVLMNIRYPVYWDMTKAKYLIFLTWSVGMIMCIYFIIVNEFNEDEYDIFLGKYFRLPFNFIFIIIAIACYSYIFHKYRLTRINPTPVGTTQTATESIFKVFRNSRFYVSVLLILNFICFVIFPEIIVSFIEDNDKTSLCRNIMFILFDISFIIDAWVYVFFRLPVKRLMWEKLLNIKCVHNIAMSNLQVKVNVQKEISQQVTSTDATNNIITITSSI